MWFKDILFGQNGKLKTGSRQNYQFEILYSCYLGVMLFYFLSSSKRKWMRKLQKMKTYLNVVLT